VGGPRLNVLAFNDEVVDLLPVPAVNKVQTGHVECASEYSKVASVPDASVKLLKRSKLT
jgi:hypothetical protein